MVSLFSLGSGQYLYPNYYQLPAYPHPYSGGALGGPIAHQYSSFPGYSHYPAVAPSAEASERSGIAVPASLPKSRSGLVVPGDIPQSRALLDGDLCPLSFLPYGSTRVKGTLEKTGTYTVEGKICWWDVADNSKFKLYVKGDSNLNKARLTVALATDCTGTSSTTVEIVDVPEIGFGIGNYFVRETSNYNNAGTNGRTSITGKRLTITNAAGTIIGCTSAVLA